MKKQNRKSVFFRGKSLQRMSMNFCIENQGRLRRLSGEITREDAELEEKLNRRHFVVVFFQRLLKI